MNKDRLIEALETALAELRKPTITFTPPKREPIKDGELEVWYSQHTWATDKQEYMWGFRDAEKVYGIGGGE